MKKVAIITLFDYINIGNKLQNYALQNTIESLGYECATVNNSKYLFNLGSYRIIKSMFHRIIPRFNIDYLERKRINIFKENSRKIIKEYQFKSIDDLDKNFDCFVIGSDQVWHNWSNTEEEIDYYFLRNIIADKKIAFAPSFGLESIPFEYKKNYVEGLNSFNKLSCREKSGAQIIKDITGKSAEIISDPTLLLSREEWLNISEQPKCFIEKDYILTYFLGTPTNYQIETVKKVAEELGCTVINIYDINDPKHYCDTPQEFVYLVNNAKYIFTNSFHGTVFSIIFNKNFTCYPRLDTKTFNMNGRIETLLDMFELKNHYDAIVMKEDYSKVNSTLMKEKEKAKNYLAKELMEKGKN